MSGFDTKIELSLKTIGELYADRKIWIERTDDLLEQVRDLRDSVDDLRYQRDLARNDYQALLEKYETAQRMMYELRMRTDGDLQPGLFSVTLVSFGTEKINTIKLVREITGMGLKDAKDLVEAVPSVIYSNVSEATANAIAMRFENTTAECLVTSQGTEP